MDIIAVNELGVRSAVLHLGHPDEPLRFTLYPMVRLARKRYYDEVSERLWRHDLVVAEGADRRGLRTRTLTLAHRLAGGTAGTGLVTTPADLVPTNVPTVWVDMPAGRLTVAERGLAWCLAAPLAAYLRTANSPAVLASALAIDDAVVRQPEWKPQHSLATVIKNERDALLIQELCKVHLRHRDQPLNVAVVFGAEHTAAVATYLISGLHYDLRETESCTVIDR